ncbi:dihydrolipoamide acetyltransferase family protein [Sphingomonas prati]|uniref:Dihydrolipoamide acetyltransferase component of pyruvate dehydrogenase complex n=1 Tax=Sphingomonas prati TaxID=1843237 RepID=A0A7W9BTC0_9SPHN|nr:dihydrolipoamide acetyltransferase family protein [Sphingomonas prati]MBB5729625.1 2-oxoisovalerate dehydrogenase E2 component (dihydrolipoyl transacylase) [Sphingomonas prati]GGE76020.1 lipoamide acyltransferase component of branched-chain alpha-keto acid dehydrogenase complex [Sphingomonas prati]
MARFTFKLPDIGEGIAEAEIVAWHVAVGDMVEEDAPLADMMTDKATVEMSAPVAGRVVEVAGVVGDQIAIGSVLAVFETEDEAEADAGDVAGFADAVAPPEAAAVADPVAAIQPEPARPVIAEPVVAAEPTRSRVQASPAVRARASDLGIDLADVKSAQGDRVRHADLDAHLRYASAASVAAVAPMVTVEPGAVEEVRVMGMRRRIAENMAESKRNIPHFAYVEECDVTELERLRTVMNLDRGARAKLTLLPFLIRAMTRALPAFPMVNARYDDAAGVVSRHASVHLGFATQTDQGLTVPVIRDAQARDVWALATEIVRLADAARRGKATRDELSGSTITLTSLGPIGGIVSTPVINRPEVAIVGVNRIVERPVVVDGQIVIRKMMNLSSSFDHRVVDGWDAASFIQAVRRLIETPALLFVD